MGTMKPRAGVRYDMPVAFGPSVAPDHERGFSVHGADVHVETDADAVAELMPRWFRPTERPIISIGYRHMRSMAWMGGRDYQLVSVRVSAHCEALPDDQVNPYTLVIWESDAAPVISGRELMGSPKLVGVIPPIQVGGRDHGFTCGEYDALLLEARLSGLQPCSADEVAAASARMEDTRSHYWKYVPGPGGRPDADYPVAIRLRTPYTHMWRGEGELTFHHPDATAAPYSGRIVERLAQLPRRSPVTATAWHATDCELMRGETRRLDQDPGGE